jgi:hypothetical protein
MKDLRLTNTGDGSLVGTLRCEMLSNAPANFEPVEIKNATGKIVDQLMVGKQIILRINYSWAQFVQKCTADSIHIAASDSNGSNLVNIN